jgi:hypothetical protein
MEFLYIVLRVLFTLLVVFYNSQLFPFLFLELPLYIVSNIVPAFRHNAFAILLIAVIIFLTLGIFAFFLVGFLPNRIILEDGTNPCDTYGNCLLLMLWAMPAGMSELPTWLQLSNATDCIFLFIIWLVLPTMLMSVFLAIIVDSLGDERKANQNRAETKKATCMMCGLTRAPFEAVGGFFHTHTAKEHNPLTYYQLFLTLLESRFDPQLIEELSGTEAILLDRLTNRRAIKPEHLFPTKHSISYNLNKKKREIRTKPADEDATPAKNTDAETEQQRHILKALNFNITSLTKVLDQMNAVKDKQPKTIPASQAT